MTNEHTRPLQKQPPYKFTGKERDAESNLDNFGARYYGSSLGRFMTADWNTDPDPVPYADLTNPQTLNLYGYVRNDPITLTDPDGHCWKGTQWLCNGFQRLYYGVFTDYGFKNHQQVVNVQEEERKWLIQHQVQRLDPNTGNPIPTDWSDAKGGDVHNTFNDIKRIIDSVAIVAGTVANQIANNAHSWAKHRGEFPGWNESEYENAIEETIQNPDAVKTLSRGRTAYWNDKEQMVVIHDPSSAEGGTAFRPADGRTYFDTNLK